MPFHLKTNLFHDLHAIHIYDITALCYILSTPNRSTGYVVGLTRIAQFVN